MAARGGGEAQAAAAPAEKPSHRKVRAALKKERRRRRRQERARRRASELRGPAEAEGGEEAGEDDGEQERRRRAHEAWLRRERRAQEEFRARREGEAARKRKAELEAQLQAEGEARRRRASEEALQKVLESGGPWQNPEPPAMAAAEAASPLDPERARCPFYAKTGACRFGDRCSRAHAVPSSSPTLVARNMFTTFGMEQCTRDDDDPDASLEYSDEEAYQHFLDFYHDVLPEFRSVGTVIQFKVSCNLEAHLRGNVYVQYRSEEECREALSLFHGRWYAGRQLQCQLCPVTRWKMAICGLYEIQRCPRGKHCNFLHVFRNPNNEFGETCREAPRAGKTSERRERPGHREDYYGRSRRRRNPRSDVSRRDGDPKSSAEGGISHTHSHSKEW